MDVKDYIAIRRLCEELHPPGLPYVPPSMDQQMALIQALEFLLAEYDKSVGPPIEPEPADEDRIYPCDDCGKMRTKAEGGTVFTICDVCWDKHRAVLDARDTVAE